MSRQDPLTVTASRVHLSRHEWVWTTDEMEAICRKLLRQNDRVKKQARQLEQARGLIAGLKVALDAMGKDIT